MSRGGSLRARVRMRARTLRIGRSERRDSVKVLRLLERRIVRVWSAGLDNGLDLTSL